MGDSRAGAPAGGAAGAGMGCDQWRCRGAPRSHQPTGFASPVMRSRRPAMNSACVPPPPGETECPEFCGGTVIVVDLSQPRHRRRSRRRGSGRSLLRHGSAARPAASGGRRSRVHPRRAVRRWCPRPGRYRAPARPGAGPLPTGPHRGSRRSLCCSGTAGFLLSTRRSRASGLFCAPWPPARPRTNWRAMPPGGCTQQYPVPHLSLRYSTRTQTRGSGRPESGIERRCRHTMGALISMTRSPPDAGLVRLWLVPVCGGPYLKGTVTGPDRGR